MAPRKPKNPIQDLSDAVGGWLGGNRGTINPQVARVSRDLGTVAQTIDTFTGGLGAAAGRDARNFQQGGSLPTNLAKTAAVNLAAGAVGAKAAQVAGRAVQSVRVVRGVSSAAKQEQKYLAQLEKYYSGKDLKKIQGLKQGNAGEYKFQRAQEAFDDGVSSNLNIEMQRQAVSDAMKSTKGPLKIVKKKSGAIRSVKTSPKKKK
jgi:hypothetical protein